MSTKEAISTLVKLILASFAITLMLFPVSDLKLYYEMSIATPPDQNKVIPVIRSEGQDILEDESRLISESNNSADTASEDNIPFKATNDSEIIDVANYRISTDEKSIIALSKMVWGEARGLPKMHQAGCVWVVLNRVDYNGYADNIVDVVTSLNHFTGYHENNPVTAEIRELVEDVLARWELEHLGYENVGRVIPSNYLWFRGDRKVNWFRDAFREPYNTWDWSLPNPYE